LLQTDIPVIVVRCVQFQTLKYSKQLNLTNFQLAKGQQYWGFNKSNAVDCRDQLWRLPLWKIQMRLRLSTQVLDGQVGSSSSSCGRRETLQRNTLIAATSCPRYGGRLLDRKGIACSWANRFIRSSLVSLPNVYSNAKPEIEANAKMLDQV
jgi:hypothetical protein